MRCAHHHHLPGLAGAGGVGGEGGVLEHPLLCAAKGREKGEGAGSAASDLAMNRERSGCGTCTVGVLCRG